jgi:hypothetical protein
MLGQGLPKAQAMLLRARMESHPTIYRVAAHDPGAGTIDLEDVLLGGTVTVYDQVLSENINNNILVAARAYPAGRFHFIEIVGPPLGADMGLEAVQFLRDCGLPLTQEGLKQQAHKFGWLWGWSEWWQANRRPLRLCNTDGDDLLMHTASFAVADPGATKQALLQREDVEHDDEEDEYVWSKPTDKRAGMAGETVTLGRIAFIDDELVLTVNSTRRFEAARAWLTKLPGISFRDFTTQSIDPGADTPLDSRVSRPEPVEVTPQMARELQEFLDERYMAWIDLPLPALGGKTPRQACRTDTGREQVTMLIRTMPDPMGPGPTIHVPRQAMLRELGLAAAAPPARPAAPQPQPRMPVESWPLDPLPRDPAPPAGAVGRNDPCPCGSGKRYKKCCGR